MSLKDMQLLLYMGTLQVHYGNDLITLLFEMNKSIRNNLID
jgi:hypothetical protein